MNVRVHNISTMSLKSIYHGFKKLKPTMLLHMFDSLLPLNVREMPRDWKGESPGACIRTICKVQKNNNYKSESMCYCIRLTPLSPKRERNASASLMACPGLYLTLNPQKK
jgi:hypothetical protein